MGKSPHLNLQSCHGYSWICSSILIFKNGHRLDLPFEFYYHFVKFHKKNPVEIFIEMTLNL